VPRFIAINDLHVSHRNPVSRIDDYNQAVFSKLHQIFLLAVKTKAVAILVAGDLFNEKTGTQPYVITQLAMWCKQVRDAGIRIIATPGNHDLRHDRYDSLVTQPLGLLFAIGFLEDCSFSSITIDGVDIIGIPYPAAKDRANWNSLPTPSSAHSIVLAHCFATPTGGLYFGEPMLSYLDLALLPYSVFHFGHDHRDNGVFRVGEKLFVNIGALSRGSISGENVARDVKCAIIDIAPGAPPKVTQIKVNARPASEVFDLALKAQKEREQSAIEQFVGQLDSDLADLGKVSFQDRLGKMDIPNEVRQRVMGYISAAEAELA
jgi:hypothetical protein